MTHNPTDLQYSRGMIWHTTPLIYSIVEVSYDTQPHQPTVYLQTGAPGAYMLFLKVLLLRGILFPPPLSSGWLAENNKYLPTDT